MAIGYPITKAALDSTMGGLVVSLRDSLTAIVQFNTLLNDSTILPDSVLTTLGYTGPSGTGGTEEAIIRASFTDLVKLNDISRGTATQASVNDFWFNAKHLAGLSFH